MIFELVGHAWLNIEKVSFLPTLKGLPADEMILVGPLKLRYF
jgi:hypothetical protein